MIAIVDYGMANLRSVEKALAKVGGAAEITSDPAKVASSDKVVLPGVGAFCASMDGPKRSGLDAAVRQAIADSKPFLGICVGLQMLFETGTEMGVTPGLGVFGGQVVEFFANGKPPETEEPLKVPHIGWNELHVNPQSRLMRGIADGSRVYFVHSFYPEPEDETIVAATSDYGGRFCAAVECGNVWATQFHPEKSGAVGLQILRNFVEWNGVVTGDTA
jgi:imidazole glycerol-phosphate synthase subunit HisH